MYLYTHTETGKRIWSKMPQGRRAVRSPPHPAGLWSTHGIEEHGEEELAPIDDLVQLAGAAGVLAVEDRVGEQPAGLPREHLTAGHRRHGLVSHHAATRAHSCPSYCPVQLAGAGALCDQELIWVGLWK